MRTPLFSEKLDALGDTVACARSHDVSAITHHMQAHADHPAIAVGAGGSLVSASYFAACRASLGHGPTATQTPMEFVLGRASIENTVVWLFSASANNSDAAAVVQAASDRGCAKLVLCTRNSVGFVAQDVRSAGGHVLEVPSADAKDGYLATHSLIGTVSALLCAAESTSQWGMSTGSIIDQLAQRITAARAKPERDRRLDIVAGLSDRDTVVALVDPNLQPLGILLETSIWESAICSIQLSDVRNFSHGRHAWLQHLQDRTLVLGITGSASHDVWANLKSELPDEVRAVEVTYNTCGRLEIALALIDGLGWLEAMGEAVGRDPGKPGIGQFGRRMFEDPSLRNLAWQLAPAVRQKLARLENTTSTKASASDLFTAWKDHFVRISEAEIGGLVLDYDGTVVTTEGRFDPPEPKIVSELVRLRNAGIDIAFASGRGKSLGRDVRAALPPEIVDAVLIGYYNGGLIRSANVDITESEHVPPSDPALEDVADWVRSSELLLENQLLKHRPLQITINAADLNSPRSFQADILECPTVRQGRAVVVASAHSFDIIPASSSKLRVLEELERRVGGGQVVLSVGDSGSERGNDNALLSRPYGVSVGDVCGAEGGCWSAFGEKRIGPTALCDILRALKPTERGGVRLDLDHLGLDERFKEWCKG